MAIPVEDILNATRDWLEAGLTQRLATIEETEPDNLALPRPQTILVTDRTPYSFSEYPVVLVVPDGAEFEDLAMGLTEITVKMSVVAALNEGDPDAMASLTLRYAEAIRSMFRDEMTVGGSVDRARVTSIEYIPAMPGDLTVHVAVLAVTSVKAITG